MRDRSVRTGIRMIRWVRDHDDRLRSDDSQYWVTRAPVDAWPAWPTGWCYTAAWRPQDAKRDGVHLGCHASGDAAKAACERHADESRMVPA